MKHFASPAFWECYGQFPSIIQEQANRCFELLKANPRHPSLYFKSIGKYRSVRVGLRRGRHGEGESVLSLGN